MGEFHGSVFLRPADLAAAVNACAGIAAGGEVRFLVAPPRDGWIAVYPSGSGQDEGVSRLLAERLGGQVLHLALHDGDVLLYLYYRDGVEVDRFSSIPDYFAPASAAETESLRGRPEALADLLPAGTPVAALAAVLDRARSRAGPDPFRAAADLERLADVLGLANVRASFEELDAGPVPGFRGERRRLVRIPDLRAERRAETARLTAETRRLSKEGVLQLTLSKKAERSSFLPPTPVWAVEPSGSLLLTWWPSRSTAPAPLDRYAPPWAVPCPLPGIALAGTVYRLAVSPDGRWLVAGRTGGHQLTEIWDLQSGERRLELPTERVTGGLVFSPDGRHLAVSSVSPIAAVQIVSTATWQVEHRLEMAANGSLLAAHPSGRFWLFGQNERVILFDLSAPARPRELSTHAHDLAAWYTAVARGEGATGFFPHERPAAAAFDPAGDRLALATSHGVRIYDWRQVLAAERQLPAPLAEADNEVVTEGGGRHRETYAVCWDGTGTLLWSGLEGRIAALDPTTGQASTLLEIPGRPAVWQLQLLRSGEDVFLVTLCQRDLFSRKRPPAELQVWSRARLAPYYNPAP
jgi:hypothetical protein